MRDPAVCLPAAPNMHRVATGELPAPIVEEILAKYADVCRVGQLKMDGEPLTWDTCGSKEVQLQNFSTALCRQLRKSIQTTELPHDVLCRTVYWVCKSISFDYVLIEVIMLLQRRMGCMSTIITQNEHGTLVDFCIDVLPGPRLRVYLKWRGTGNIIEVSPETGSRKVRGTFFELSTEFNLPPDQNFVPEYKLKLQLGKSVAMRLANQVWSKICCSECHPGLETIHVDSPLQSDTMEFHSLQSLHTPQIPVSPIWFADEDTFVGMLVLRPACVRGLVLDGSVSHGGGAPPGPTAAGAPADVRLTCTVGAAAQSTAMFPRGRLLCARRGELWYSLRERDLRGAMCLEVSNGAGQPRRESLGSASVPLQRVLPGVGGGGGGTSSRLVEMLKDQRHGRQSVIELEVEYLPMAADQDSDGGSSWDSRSQDWDQESGDEAWQQQSLSRRAL